MTEDTRQRLDKWLWFARFFKTRSLAAKTVSAGGVRVNGTRVAKPAAPVATGDVLTFAQGREIRVIRIEAPGKRRGPAPEAQALYTDVAPPSAPSGSQTTERVGKRPTKKDRRALDKTRATPLE
ncbi:RNA-binding S4 domain-containing protein [Tropicimonas sp. S265A]|uniref:RNA-binding S4 domain-containing protein n=1 Tax=Tropicimonas sp. S265A TaxID=3415134 RepID=UPI003C7E0FD9